MPPGRVTSGPDIPRPFPGTEAPLVQQGNTPSRSNTAAQPKAMASITPPTFQSRGPQSGDIPTRAKPTPGPLPGPTQNINNGNLPKTPAGRFPAQKVTVRKSFPESWLWTNITSV